MDGQFHGARLVPIDAIEVGIRMRTTNPRQVIALKDSINAIGLLNSISVFQLPVSSSEKTWGLIAGAHRLAACQSPASLR